MLPDVPSIIVPPGFSNPFRSASSIIRTAMRSLIELPGLTVSILAKTVAFTRPFVIRLIRIIGVSPIASRTLLKTLFAVVVLMDATIVACRWLVTRGWLLAAGSLLSSLRLGNSEKRAASSKDEELASLVTAKPRVRVSTGDSIAS